MSDPSATVTEVTALDGATSQARQLIEGAFAERLGEIAVACDFHRHWNGGWRCRATAAGKPPLEFVLLRTPTGALLAMPIPMPSGWKPRGVAASDGTRWGQTDRGEIVRIA